jgi:hypothetical protein
VAKQDFLNGGFTGKVGNLVGERWKNKRYVRTYVVPHDPKTPDQLIARTIFQRAVRLSQEAMLINGHQGYWPTTIISEWQGRMGQCLRHLRAGDSDADSIPIYPDGYVTAVNIRILSLWRSASTAVHIQLDPATVTAPCNIRFSIEYYGTFNNILVDDQYDTTLVQGQSELIYTYPIRKSNGYPLGISGGGYGLQPPGTGTVSVIPFDGPVGVAPNTQLSLGVDHVELYDDNSVRVHWRIAVPQAYDGVSAQINSLCSMSASAYWEEQDATGTLVGGQQSAIFSPAPTRYDGEPIITTGFNALAAPAGSPLIWFNPIEW